MTVLQKKRTKFIIAAVVAVLCIASITSATFALFTANLNDGTIGINSTAGNLEVDIIDDSGNSVSLIGQVLDFVNYDDELVSSETEILFEPGALYYTEGFRVVNKGNIRMNFIAYMSTDNEFDKKFYDAFEVWITSDPSDRSNMEKIKEFEGSLEPGKQSDTYYLVFRMKESAGNEFQNTTFKGVGITVCAVQGNVKIE